MKKIILTLLLANVYIFANNTNDNVMVSYLTNGLSKNKNIQNLSVEVVSKNELHDKKDWSAYIMAVSGDEVRGNESRHFSRRSLYFTDGTLVTPDLRNVLTDERYKETMSPKFDAVYYDDSFYLFGNKDAKHKIAIFSDPLCPYCIKYVPKVLKTLKEKPSEYAVYYYHLPLNMHPAAKTLVKAAVALEEKNNNKFDITKFYTIKVEAYEQNQKVILDAFNKVFNSKITLQEIKSSSVIEHFQKSIKISKTLMVNGTPSLFFDGEKDGIERFLISANSSKKIVCDFNQTKLSFNGTKTEQARCLLREVKEFGKIENKPQESFSKFEKILPNKIPFSQKEVKLYLKVKKIKETDIGGVIDNPISKANNGDPKSIYANYFVIHDTSTPNYENGEIPNNINNKSWEYNNLDRWYEGNKSKAHVFINRLGESITPLDFSIPWRATKFELEYGNEKPKGLFLHVELIQPRKSDSKGAKGNDALSPTNGFTDEQYERLALVYLVSSVRKGEWLIPAFHGVIDSKKVNGHDDPQHFSLNKWTNAILTKIKEIKSDSY